jgi:hypothetical protein
LACYVFLIREVNVVKLRWIECDATYGGKPVAMTPNYPECGPDYYKLQYWIKIVGHEDGGEWVDVEVET